MSADLSSFDDNGEGVEQDKDKAVKWWTKAAEQGHATAQTYLQAVQSEAAAQADRMAEELIREEEAAAGQKSKTKSKKKKQKKKKTGDQTLATELSAACVASNASATAGICACPSCLSGQALRQQYGTWRWR